MYRLYLFDQYGQLTEEMIARASRILPKERCIRAMYCRKKINRDNTIVAYLMLQYALRECFGITSFKIAFGEYGKPYLPEYLNVYFNISHCNTGCVVAVADCPVGVDIQDVRHFSWDTARHVCCEQELEELEACMDRDRLFTRMWAMKESFVKMEGTGISYGLKEAIHSNIYVQEREHDFIALCGDFCESGKPHSVRIPAVIQKDEIFQGRQGDI